MGDRTLGFPPFGAKLKDKHYTGKENNMALFWPILDTSFKMAAGDGGDDGHGRGRCSSTKGIRTSAPVNSPDTARPPPAAS